MKWHGIALMLGVCWCPLWAESPQDAQKTLAILKQHCYRCHGENGSVEGGFNYVQDLERLVLRRKVIPNNPAQSSLFKRIQDGSMPPPEVKERLSNEEVQTLKQWIQDGAKPLVTRKNPLFSQGELNEILLSDLEKIEPRARRFQRYFSLHSLAAAGASDDELQTYRNALSKVVNSLSWHPKIRNPEKVDARGLFLRIDLRWYMWDSTIWNRILQEYPYAIIDETSAGRVIMAFTATRVPILRADWFIATASRPNLYQEILQLPANLSELEKQLRVDSHLNIQQERILRVAFNGSGVSRNNRILERHDSVHGYYWRTYDFEEIPQALIDRGQLAPDRRNVFAYPLGPGTTENTFQHIGGEAIFSLPNGLQGYFIMNQQNARLDRAPTQIVSDPKRPDRAVELGVSCMGCHIQGIIPKGDQVHDFLKKNPKILNKLDRELALTLYPESETSLKQMQEDSNFYKQAVAKTGAVVVTGKAEPVIALTLRYEADLDVASAAAEIGLTVEEFQQKILKSPTLGRQLGTLRIGGGTVARNAWVQAFADVVRETQAGTLFQANFIGSALPDNTGETDPLELPSGQANQAAITADGRKVALASIDRRIRWVDVEARRDLRAFVGHTASVWSVALSQDGAVALSGGGEGIVRSWDTSNGRQLHTLEGHTGLITALAMHQKEKWALSGGIDGQVIAWDLQTGKEKQRYSNLGKYITALAWDTDGKGFFVATGKEMKLVSFATGQVEKNFTGHTGAINSIFVNDQKQIVTASDDKTALLWDRNAKVVQTFKGHAGPVRSVCCNAKGNWLVTASQDGTVQVWQMETGKPLWTSKRQNQPVIHAQFTPPSKQVVLILKDGTPLVWDLPK